MLVLSRRKTQSIHIGPNVVVSVAEIRRSSVKLTIDAPPHVPVHRTEVLRRIKETTAAITVTVGGPPRMCSPAALWPGCRLPELPDRLTQPESGI